jgi:hypothetical protein
MVTYLPVQPSANKTVLPSAFLRSCHFNILRILFRNFLCKEYYQVMWCSVEHWLKWCGTVHISTELNLYFKSSQQRPHSGLKGVLYSRKERVSGLISLMPELGEKISKSKFELQKSLSTTEVKKIYSIVSALKLTQVELRFKPFRRCSIRKSAHGTKFTTLWNIIVSVSLKWSI